MRLNNENKIYINKFVGIPEPKKIPIDKKSARTSSNIKKVYEYVLTSSSANLFYNNTNQSHNNMTMQDKQILNSVIIWDDSDKTHTKRSFMIHELFCKPQLH